jgi:ribosome biogenesis GTPase
MSNSGGSRLYGIVTAIQANYYWVKLEGVNQPPCLCTRRSRLKKIGQRVLVGDRVGLEVLHSPLAEAPAIHAATGEPLTLMAIAEILPRQSELSRPWVANADQILLVFSLVEPAVEPWQLSRFLVKAESTSLKVQICLSKQDLIAPELLHLWQERLGQWGYKTWGISSLEPQSLLALRNQLKGQITILAGPSGVGKSSLINTLIPGSQQRVNQVSGKLQKGRHTTRHVELFELPDGGLLADTPGFNQPELQAEPADIIHYFPEVRTYLERGECYFKDCLHRGEPHCAILPHWERYEHYLKFLSEALDRQSQQHQPRGTESQLKLKMGTAGRAQYEPKLETKKYRRTSRRQAHQTLMGRDSEGEV